MDRYQSRIDGDLKSRSALLDQRPSLNAKTLSGSICYAVLRGTRMPVSAILENLEAGANIDDIMEWFDGLDHEQVKARSAGDLPTAGRTPSISNAFEDSLTPCKRSASSEPVRLTAQLANAERSASVDVWARVSMKFGIEKNALSRSVRVDQIQTSVSGSRNGSSRNRTALTIVNMIVFAAMPSPRMTTTKTVNGGVLIKLRTVVFISSPCSM